MSLWGEGRLGAVSLTFDDGMECHLSRVIPLLNEHGLQGTFYINPNPAWQAQGERWREAHAQGHEVGNHTLSHPCSQNFGWMGQRRGLENMTLAEIEEDIESGKAAISQIIPEQKVQSFCYPCYQDYVGRGATRQSYVPIVAKHHPAARGRGEGINRPNSVDLHYLWSYDCQRMSAAELIGLCEAAAAGEGWAVLTFHGVGEGHLLVGESDFIALCAHLKRNRERLWTAPLVTVAQRIADTQG